MFTPLLKEQDVCVCVAGADPAKLVATSCLTEALGRVVLIPG